MTETMSRAPVGDSSPGGGAGGTASTGFRRYGRWFGRMTLRGRLALFTATAVSLAVVMSALTGWLVAGNEMTTQVDKTLAHAWAPNAHTPPQARLRALNDWCQGAVAQPWTTSDTVPTVIFADGTSCPQSDARAVKVVPEDLSVARSGTSGAGADSRSRHGRLTDGEAVRVYVVSYGPVVFNGARTTAAVALSQPLEPVQDALSRLAFIAAGAAALVIAASAAGALWIARTALRPVDRLTRAAEHIARTQEPGTTIAVSGGDEIARLGRSFNAMSTALANSRDSQSQLIADAGHELRTPLTSLRTNVDLLVRSEETGRPLPESTRARLFVNMKAQMLELSTLIGDLLVLSRPAPAAGATCAAALGLHDVVSRALDRARLSGPSLVFDVDLQPWYVRADAHTMERAVVNLLDNAVKFSPVGGAVDVSLTAGILTVRDHGPGIAPDDMPHVFDRFWRSPFARQLPGSGLGLAIVAQAVRDVGGEVSLASAAPGPDGTTGGAVATVKLPGSPTPPARTVLVRSHD
ncbi:ATP-binding protein [Kitasatospora sp. NBC_00315]|uniref:HAMP domain-containing sensor histidine kinase n=1 Tax=Kitasatospora sp. NBC_00315 TaxID=2975963 RepID=UPI003251F890